MNARLNNLTSPSRTAAALLFLLTGISGTVRGALPAPIMGTAQVPTPYTGFIGITWQNQEPAPPPSMFPTLSLHGVGVYRSINNGSWSRIALVAAGTSQHTVDPISRSVNYRFRVRLEPAAAFHLVNHQRTLLGQPLLASADYTSPFSEIVTISYPAVATPSGLIATAILPTSIRFNWLENEPGSVSSVVKVMRKDLATGLYFDERQFTVAAPATTFDAINLLPNTRYGFQVRSVDPFGNLSSWSGIRDRATLARTPTALRAMLASNNTVHLSWNDYLENSGIQVLFTTSVSFTQIDGNPLVAGVNNFPAAIPGVALSNPITNANVHFTVRAVNLDGVAGPSVSPVTIASGPNPPASRLIFRNSSQLPLRSVLVDGREMVVAGFNIPAGGNGTIVMNNGSHTLHASGFNSMCNRNTLEFPSAASNQSFTLNNAPITITVPAILLRVELAQDGGMFQAEDGFGDWYAFASNGTWAYGYFNTVQASGTLSGNYSPGISTVNMSYAGGPFSAVFNECDETLTVPVFNNTTGAYDEITYAR